MYIYINVLIYKRKHYFIMYNCNQVSGLCWFISQSNECDVERQLR